MSWNYLQRMIWDLSAGVLVILAFGEFVLLISRTLSVMEIEFEVVPHYCWDRWYFSVERRKRNSILTCCYMWLLENIRAPKERVFDQGWCSRMSSVVVVVYWNSQYLK